jgi:hypothetical protein
MRGFGVRNPSAYMWLSLGVMLVAWACVAWGAHALLRTGGQELVPSLMVGIGLLPAMLAPFAALNFWWGVRVFAAIRRGQGVIGRWSVNAAELAAFAAQEPARREQALNAWILPREVPPGGVDIRFTADGVLAGDSFFALSPLGVFRITHVALLRDGAPAIAFGTALTQANRFGARTSLDALRLPYPPDAEAEASRMLEHFRRVLTGETVVRPKRLPRLRLIMLSAVAFGLVCAGAGLAMLRAGASPGGLEAELLLALGVPLVLFGSIGAFTAQAMIGRQRRRG